MLNITRLTLARRPLLVQLMLITPLNLMLLNA
jgi:hypothetical protein